MVKRVRESNKLFVDGSFGSPMRKANKIFRWYAIFVVEEIKTITNRTNIQNGLILSTNITPASQSDSTYLTYATIYSMHTDQKIEVIYADKRPYLKNRYIVEQYFGLATLFDDRSRARFTTIVNNSIDALFRQFAFNLRKGAGILRCLPA